MIVNECQVSVKRERKKDNKINDKNEIVSRNIYVSLDAME
jgi:hypothetical protein